MRTLRSELAGILGKPFRPFGGLPQLISFIVGVVSLAVNAGAIWATLQGQLPVAWLVVTVLATVLLVVLVYLIAVVLVQAREASRRPWFEVSDLKIEDTIQLFFVRVKNGPVDAWIKGFVGPFDDPVGGVHTQKRWEGHWRAEPPEFDGKLRGGDERDYGWVQVDKPQGGHPRLIVYTKEQADWLPPIPLGPTHRHRYFPISKDVELEKQETVVLNIHMTCSDWEGNKAMEINRSYRIAPDLGSSIGYKILPPLPPPPESPPSCWLCEKSDGLRRMWNAHWYALQAAWRACRRDRATGDGNHCC